MTTNTTKKSLYARLKEEGIEIANHYSDLYFPVTPETSRILRKEYPKAKVEIFINLKTKTPWYDVFGGYDPYWEECERKGKEREANERRTNHF